MKMVNQKKGMVIGMVVIILCAIGVVVFYATLKKGFHEDEYYSYYSTNFTEGWTVPDGEFVDMEHYAKEFMVLPGERFQYSLVKTIQSWDVHPPMYYWFLHTICSLTPEIFSKWQGLGLNIGCFVLSVVLFYLCAVELTRNASQKYLPLLITACYAFTPGIVSGVMFVRMYTMLSGLMLLAVYLHLLAYRKHKFNNVCLLFAMAMVSYVGFLTHYYYLIFQGILTFSVCILLLIRTKKIQVPFFYGGSIAISVILGIVTYPSALGQMFRGQRGAEATANFFEISNTLGRIEYFMKLANKHWFGNLGLVLTVLLIILIVGRVVWGKRENLEISIVLGITSLGYFLAVSKTALMLGDSSIRYILPILGPLWMTILSLVDYCQEMQKKDKIMERVLAIVLACVFLFNIVQLVKGNVLFLYPEDTGKVMYAKEHHDGVIVYIYHGDESWKVWESTNELLEYDKVYFVSDESVDKIENEVILNAEELIVYVSVDADEELQLQRLGVDRIQQENDQIVMEEKFCNVYEIKDKLFE